MKRFVNFLILIFCLSPLTAAPLKFYWDFGTAFLGGDVDSKNNSVDFDWEIDVQVLDFRLETENGFTFGFSPFNVLWEDVSSGKEDVELITFGNFTVAYDFFKHERMVELGPYVSVFTLALDSIKNFRIDAGLLLNMYFTDIWPEAMIAAEENMHLRCELISAKTGVRLNQLKPEFYFDVGINLISLGMILCSAGPENFEPCSYP
ncbi:MAG: hypothetical protein J6X78_01680 [Treponema sp.]|nr:hypothetical protein [Treponema sp.]